jgi:RNA 3'-terminal phosphate cyclase (ATP)
LQRAYGRALAAMGALLEIGLKRFGFYPTGGGGIVITVQPCKRLKAG